MTRRLRNWMMLGFLVLAVLRFLYGSGVAL